jgi:diguanylate cyclase (GGDEF)-like protein
VGPDLRAVPGKPARVLIADDDPVTRTVLEEYLRPEGYELRSVVDGAKAVEEMLLWHPDVILLDINMPIMNGFEVLARMAHNDRLAATPVIVVSSSSHYEVRALDHGAMDFLTKPPRRLELLARVRNMVRLTRQQRELEELNERLHQAATTDALTRLLNRGAFLEALDAELDRARRYQTPVTVILLDVDHFKSINDTLGHAAGDSVLAGVGNAIARSIRRSDVAGRVGGDEFAIALPHAEGAAGRSVAEKLCELTRSGSTGSTGGFTLSAGIACSMSTSLDRLMEAADRALYAAKNAGRDRVVVLHGDDAALQDS